MNLILNIIWLALGGIPLFIGYILLGLLLCITIIGIPFGVAVINIGVSLLTPFGKSITAKHQINHGCITMPLTVLWLVTGGIALSLAHLITGVLLCLTIVGILLGVQNFKFMQMALMPYHYELR